MSDVSLGLSGGWPQQLDSLISNSTWMGDTGRQGDFFIYALREEESPGSFICGSTLGPLSKLCSTGEGSTGCGEADSPQHYSDLL